MLERLANVIYWTASTLAVLAALFFAWITWSDWASGFDVSRFLILPIIVVPAIYLFGRAVRYVLAGK